MLDGATADQIAIEGPGTPQHRSGTGLVSLRQCTSLLIAISVAACVAVTWQRLRDAAATIVPILWTLAPLLALHAAQIALSTAAWSKLLETVRPVPLTLLFRLRVIREGIDSLLPIAQVGGEMIASSILVRSGVPSSLAAGSIMVDMILELVGQLGFLTLGYLLISCLSQTSLSHGQILSLWLSLAGMFAAGCAALVAAHRLGALRLVWSLAGKLAAHVTAGPAFCMTGLHDAVTRLSARREALGAAVSLHFLHWLTGAVEVLIVLRAMGVPIGPEQAIIMNAIGVGARSAGFMVPGYLVVQESGFMLGAALAGLPPQAALVFSLVRRLRELAVGVIGVALWRAAAASATAPAE